MEPFENDKNQNTEPVMAENMTSAPAKRYEGKSFIFSDIPSQEKSFKFCVQPLAWTRREWGIPLFCITEI